MAHCCFSVSTAVSSARKASCSPAAGGQRQATAVRARSRSRLAGMKRITAVSSSALASHGEVKLAAKLMGDRMIEPKASSKGHTGEVDALCILLRVAMQSP